MLLQIAQPISFPIELTLQHRKLLQEWQLLSLTLLEPGLDELSDLRGRALEEAAEFIVSDKRCMIGICDQLAVA